MADTGKRRNWAGWLTALAALLCFGSVFIAIVLAVGSGQGLWHFRVGLTPLRYLFYAAAAGGVIALIALFLGRRTGKLIMTNLLAIFVAVGFLLYVGSLARTAFSVPPIHDITTNLDDMPQFGRLPVREDNYKSVEKTSRAELQPLPPVERWRRLHREAYGDLRTVRVPWSVAETVQRAERLARDNGWEIAHVDAGAGMLEATATTFFFRFKDDVVLRARAAPGGSGTDVDMRSLSRVGGSDVGKNAERIREFLADLQRG
ncbi:MAG TPA: DUF1499 domain-containing protein [Allosphingosinicella sp.]|jgi:hypothetical protein|nr:DUF1499 domain-containing protein [Allosphingosinicella sp.]